MNDKEMLELAAKAVGIESELEEFMGDLWWGNDDDTTWNPLIDDGDALRLAVGLRLTLLIESSGVYVGQNAISFNSLSSQSFLEDPYAATRRAIVRAAAEIGKVIK